MREIKFRAYIPSLSKVCFKGKGLSLRQIWRVGEEYFNEDVVWVEYTGLKDKNGKEIYEGDIVKFTIPEDERLKTISKIVWNDSGFYQQRIDNDRIMFIGGYEGVIEVIGNIYENKELLK